MIAIVASLSKADMIQILKECIWLMTIPHNNKHQASDSYEVVGFEKAVDRIFKALDTEDAPFCVAPTNTANDLAGEARNLK